VASRGLNQESIIVPTSLPYLLTSRGTSVFAALRLLLAPLLLAPALAAAQGAISVGRTLPITGPIAVYGNAKKVGGEAYIERFNREGGLRGRRISLTTLDDRYDANEAVKNIRTLEGAGVVAILGLLGVPAVAAALPVMEQLRLPAVGLTSGAAAARTPVRRYGFPVRASYADEAGAITKHLASLNLTRVIIVRQSNPFGNSVADNMLAALQAAGIKPVADIALKIDGSDNKEVVAKLAAIEQVNVVFLAMQSPVAIPLIEILRAGGVQSGANLFSISAVDTTQLAAALKDKARGVVISQIVPLTQPTLPLVREYIRDLKAINGGAPSFYGLEAYVEAKILVEGLRRSGNAITREALVTALESLGTFDLGGMLVTYGPGKREGSRFVDLIMVTRDGALIR
jgi:ABC-type branched-subunit amino acid transport system substrate-binding protein